MESELERKNCGLILRVSFSWAELSASETQVKSFIWTFKEQTIGYPKQSWKDCESVCITYTSG